MITDAKNIYIIIESVYMYVMRDQGRRDPSDEIFPSSSSNPSLVHSLGSRLMFVRSRMLCLIEFRFFYKTDFHEKRCSE